MMISLFFIATLVGWALGWAIYNIVKPHQQTWFEFWVNGVGVLLTFAVWLLLWFKGIVP